MLILRFANLIIGAGDVAQWLRALAFVEDPGLISSTHMVFYILPFVNSSSRGSDASSDLIGCQACACCIDRHVSKTLIYIMEINLKIK